MEEESSRKPANLRSPGKTAIKPLCVVRPEDVVESDVVTIAEFFQFIAHVPEEQAVFVEVHFQTSFEQPKNQPGTTHRYHALHHNITRQSTSTTATQSVTGTQVKGTALEEHHLTTKHTLIMIQEILHGIQTSTVFSTPTLLVRPIRTYSTNHKRLFFPI